VVHRNEIQGILSACKSLKEVGQILGESVSGNGLVGLRIPTFGGEDVVREYDYRLGDAGLEAVSWNKTSVLVTTEGGYSIFTRRELHRAILGTLCPFCGKHNCVPSNPCPSRNCSHYLGFYDGVNCEFHWEDAGVESLVAEYCGSDGDPNDLEGALEVLGAVIGAVTTGDTKEEVSVSERTTSPIPIVFASTEALRKLSRVFKKKAGADLR